MLRLEIVFKQDDQAILMPGNRVEAEYWNSDDEAVVLFDAAMLPIATGPVGQLGRSILPNIRDIKVFSVGETGVTHMKLLTRINA